MENGPIATQIAAISCKLGILERTGWRVRGRGGAAEALGLKPTTLEARMKKLGVVRK
jgi:transcriptional regulator with GAF, ATPase, and Fis domain